MVQITISPVPVKLLVLRQSFKFLIIICNVFKLNIHLSAQLIGLMWFICMGTFNIENT